MTSSRPDQTRSPGSVAAVETAPSPPTSTSCLCLILNRSPTYRLWNYHWPDGDLVTSIMHDIWRVTDQVADGQFPWSEVAGCIRSAEWYFGPKAEIPQHWIESLRRVL